MGSAGVEALSQITGLEVVQGYYDFQADHINIYANGKSNTGLSWNITIEWKNGLPNCIVLSEPEVEL